MLFSDIISYLEPQKVMSNRRFKRATTSQNPTISPAAQKNSAIYIYKGETFFFAQSDEGG